MNGDMAWIWSEWNAVLSGCPYSSADHLKPINLQWYVDSIQGCQCYSILLIAAATVAWLQACSTDEHQEMTAHDTYTIPPCSQTPARHLRSIGVRVIGCRARCCNLANCSQIDQDQTSTLLKQDVAAGRHCGLCGQLSGFPSGRRPRGQGADTCHAQSSQGIQSNIRHLDEISLVSACSVDLQQPSWDAHRFWATCCKLFGFCMSVGDSLLRWFVSLQCQSSMVSSAQTSQRARVKGGRKAGWHESRFTMLLLCRSLRLCCA